MPLIVNDECQQKNITINKRNLAGNINKNSIFDELVRRLKLLLYCARQKRFCYFSKISVDTRRDRLAKATTNWATVAYSCRVFAHTVEWYTIMSCRIRMAGRIGPK